jgi:hypothetical protein
VFVLPLSANTGPLVNQLSPNSSAKPARPRAGAEAQSAANPGAEAAGGTPASGESGIKAAVAAPTADAHAGGVERKPGERRQGAAASASRQVTSGGATQPLDAQSAARFAHQTAQQMVASPQLAYAAQANSDARAVYSLLRD